MPIISVVLWKGRTTDQKRRLVAELTQGTSRALGVRPEEVIIMIQDFEKSNWGLKGKLASELDESKE